MNAIGMQAILPRGYLRRVGGRHPGECLRAFLTTEPNDVVGPIYPKAMPGDPKLSGRVGHLPIGDMG